METMPVKPERKAQLEAFAARNGQDAAALLDDVLADYLDREQKEYQEAAEGICEGLEDIKAGRMESADVVFERLRVKHGLPS
jgi:predicted transcriptional regulator